MPFPTATRALGVLTRVLLRRTARRWARPGYFPPLRSDADDEPPARAPGRVALVACHWLGDTFWDCQTLPALRTLWPAARFTVFTKPFARPLWRGAAGDVDVVAAPLVTSDRHRERVDWRALRAFAAERRADDFDLAIDFTGNRYSAFFVFGLRPGRSLGFNGGELGWLYSRRVDAQLPGAHLAERPWRLIEPLLGRFVPPGPATPLQPPVFDGNFADAAAGLGLDPSPPVGVIAPGTNREERRWPADGFVAAARGILARRPEWQWVVTGSAKEAELCREVARGIAGGDGADGVDGARARTALALGADWPLPRVFALLSGCSGFIGNDSGLGHLTAAYGRPTVVVFTGGTTPGNYRPLGPRAASLVDPVANRTPARTAATAEAIAVFLLEQTNCEA